MVVLKQVKVSPVSIVSVPAIVLMAGPAFAAVYLTVEEAQQAIFPGESFASLELTLSQQQQKAIEEKSGVSGNLKRAKIWRAAQGGFFLVDEVIGKHEFITYAVGINKDGSIRQVEILEYREAYGDEIRQKRWRKQFVGKNSVSALELNRDIKNIAGATLSCRHVTEGVKRALVLYELML